MLYTRQAHVSVVARGVLCSLRDKTWAFGERHIRGRCRHPGGGGGPRPLIGRIPPDCYKRQQKQAKWLQPTRLRHASAAEMRLSRRQAGRLAIDVDKGSRRHSGGRQGPQLRRPPAHDVDKGPSSVSQKRVTCLARETPSPARYSAHLASQCDTGRPATRPVQPANLGSSQTRSRIATAESNDEKFRRRCASWLEK